MATVIRKAKLGVEDIQTDLDGSGATMSVQKSDGTFRSVRRVNASHIPITTACRAKKQASGAAIGTTEVDATLVQALDDLEDLGQPDGTTLLNTAGSLAVKAGGVGTTHLADAAVTYAKMQHISAQGKLLGRSTAAAGDVEEVSCDGTTVELPAGGNLKVKDGGIAATQLATNAVVEAKIADDAVTKGKLAWDQSHYVLGSGTITISGANTTGTATVAGALVGDLCLCTVKSNTGAVSSVRHGLVSAADTVTVTLTAAPGGAFDAVIQFILFRAN
jgi:hypothetical protein